MIHGEHKSARRPDIDLGLAVAELHAVRGHGMSHAAIARYCACSWQAIYRIEQRALRRLRWSASRHTISD
jgi:hypothetical protein